MSMFNHIKINEFFKQVLPGTKEISEQLPAPEVDALSRLLEDALPNATTNISNSMRDVFNKMCAESDLTQTLLPSLTIDLGDEHVTQEGKK